MRTTLPVLLSLLFLYACGDNTKDTDDPIDPTDGDLTETDTETDGEEEEQEEEPAPSPGTLTLNANSYAEADLFAGDNKLQVLTATDAIQLGYTVEPPDTEVTWSSSAPSIVSVSDSGELTVNSEGAVEITVSTGELTDSLIVEVGDSIARGQYQLREDRHVPAGGEGGEGGLYVDEARIRTGAVLEPTPSMNEASTSPVVLPLQLCTGQIFRNWNGPFAPGWRATQLNADGFTALVNYCSQPTQVEGPYVLTKPMTIASSADVSPFSGAEGDTSGWSEEENVCAMAIEGHNAFVWQGHTLPETLHSELRFSIAIAGDVYGPAALEISIFDTDAGEFVASTTNRTLWLDNDSWTNNAVNIDIPSGMQGKTVDIVVDVTGVPSLQTAHGQDNIWINSLEFFSVVPAVVVPPPPGPIGVPGGGLGGPPGGGGFIPIPVGVDTYETISTHNCDSLDNLKSLRMFEGRTTVFATALDGIGSTERRVFIPHDEEALFVRNIDTYTNASGQSATVTVPYTTSFFYGGSSELSNYLLANGRGLISLPNNNRYEHAAAIVVGEENGLIAGYGSAAGNSILSLNDAQTGAVMSFMPFGKYYGPSNGSPNETYLTPFIEDIVSSFASDPLDSKYATGISTDLWDQMLGWSNPDPLTPVPEDSATPDTGAL